MLRVFSLPAITLASFQEETFMNIEEDCQGCTDSIVYGLTKTSEFRTRKAKDYPHDLRNAAAAATLKQLAKSAAELSPDFWNLLQIHGNGKTQCHKPQKMSGSPTNPKAMRFSFSG
jgi:hypothetical protein